MHQSQRMVGSGLVLQWKPKIPLDRPPREEQATRIIDSSPPRETQEPPTTSSRLVFPSSPIISAPLPGHTEENPTNSDDDQVPPHSHQLDHMANFVCDPNPFVPFGAHLEEGWHRPARSRVAISGEPPCRHEEFAIVTLDPPPPSEHARVALNDVVHLLQDNFPVRVASHILSPLGLGLVEFDSAIQRQSMLDISPIAINDNSMLRVVKHDEAINLRACHYSRDCWIMFLAFPLDYQLECFVDAAVAPFGRRLFWHQSRNKSVSLVHCRVLDPTRVPRSVVISQGTAVGANNRSWTVPTYILGGNIAEILGDEDPIPADGNPHPAHGQPLAGNPNNFQNWLHDHAGAGAQVLADAGINDQLMQDINEEIAVVMNQNFAHNAVQANDEEEMQQGLMADWVPQHPDQPQDTITFDQSGSTTNYLRATGPDVHLSVEEVLAAVAAMQGD